MEKKFLNANDVAQCMDISVSMAYKVIRKLNNELNAAGYLTIAGKVSRAYLETRLYGGLPA